MSYVVLARKWRPQTFDEIVGQEHVTTTLKNSIEAGRMAHAYLFAGPRGVGKTSTARILSKALNCQEGPTPSPCLKCTSCKEIAGGKSLDILEVDGASNRGIDEIRNLRANIGFAPASGRYKVYIIDEVHMLTTEAFNALLKTLEEPPAHVKFIFATTQPHKVLPTILSRCQRFDFRRITVNELVDKLKEISSQEKIKVSPEALLNVARAADGSMRDAESVLDQLVSFCEGEIAAADVDNMLGMVSQDIFVGLTQAVINRDSTGALKIVDELINEGKDISQLLSGLIDHFRNIMVAKISPQAEGIIDLPKERVKELVELAHKFSFEEIFFVFNILSQAEYNIKRSNLIRAPLEMAVIKITRLDSLVRVPEMIDRLTRLEQNIKSMSLGSGTGSIPSSSNRPGAVSETARKQAPAKTEAVIRPQEQSLTRAADERTEEKDIKSDTETKIGSGRAEAAADLTLMDITRKWIKILSVLSQKSPSCSAYLSGGKPVEYKQGSLTIKFGLQNGFHKETLEDLKNRQMVHDALGQILGVEVKTKFIMAGSEEDKWPSAEDDSALETVQQLPADFEEALEETPGGVINEVIDTPETIPVVPSHHNDKEIEPIVKTAAKIFKAKQIKVLK